MKKLLSLGLLLAASVCGRAQGPATADGPTLSFELRPDRPAYWVGERGTAVLTLSPGELDLLSDPEVEFSGWTGGAAAMSAAPAPAGSLRWTKPVLFDAPGTFRAETRLGGQFGHVERRGIMTIRQSLGRRVVSAPPRSIVVKPLPDAGRPADFSGLVGSFSLSGALDADACAPGDIVNLRWELRGPGADELADVPSAAPGPAFKVYPPRVEEKAAGRLVVSQALVPVSTNAARVAAVSLSVFDPATGTYRPLSCGPFPLRVAEKPPEPDGAADATTPSADGVSELPQDPATPLPARPGAEVAPAAAVPARFAPADSARELFVLGAGEAAVVREVSPDGAWARILRRADGATGWIPSAAAAGGAL